ncbi:peroxisomal targeting signal 1 receptor [Planococcus citri]|uniref:peroxisomal targeting signal 1 receptor n=1 Tax=Planococcus citri TaxID=170843 RepID=UPI0031F7844B
MSFRNLVEDQCGTANSLVQLSNHFVQDRALQDQGILHPFQHENFPNENEQTPQLVEGSQPFRMDSLLSEMRDLEMAALTKSVPSPEPYTSLNPVQLSENVSDWANQYIESGNKFADVDDKPFQSSIWSNDTRSASLEPIVKPVETNNFDFNANWAQEYFKESPPFAGIPDVITNVPAYLPAEMSELQYVAGQVADSMSDQRFTHSKFLKFMNQVSEGQVQIDRNEVIGRIADNDESAFSEWANVSGAEKATSNVPMTNENEQKFSEWAKPSNLAHESTAQNTKNEPVQRENVENEDLYSKELWSKLTERWEQLNLGNQDPWDSEFNKFVASLDTYNFAEENPMADKVNALEEGKKKAAEGDLSSAVLCFEAAVQQNPESVEGWLLLGRTQAENEQDEQAIAALKKCLKLDAENLEALKELAVCYTNENYQYQACYTLKEWLANNEKYKDIAAEHMEKSKDPAAVTSILSMKFFNEVLNLYLQAVQRFPSPEDADADVQNGLGVLLTLISDYEKATDCFETAVKIRPNDSRLWNRLGATLANGHKPEQALEAYRKALALSPGYIRARYNLGITCVHLKMYKQATEHLLIALNQQIAGRGIHGEKSRKMSESIWTTLRLALSLLDRRDLLPIVERRNLDELNSEFNIKPGDFNVTSE